MIVLFTSVEKGGIAQFAIQLLNEIVTLGKDAICFLPDTHSVFIPKNLENKIETYSRIKTINIYNQAIKKLGDRINFLSPECVWFADNSIISNQVALNINCQYMLTIHDVNFHPSFNDSLSVRLKNRYQRFLSKVAESKSRNVILLSPNSLKEYNQKNRKNSSKSRLMNLGAHIPQCEPASVENVMDNEYYLFFGRIDKYKGLDRLVEAYSKYGLGKRKLVIAGSGSISEDVINKISSNGNIILLNRFINDNEMVYLFQHAVCLFLPYIEASQSGIIPIAYYYGIPVVVSDVPGLTQFVINEKTGLICSSINDYVDSMHYFDNDSVLESFKINCQNYYFDHMDWKNSITKILALLS